MTEKIIRDGEAADVIAALLRAEIIKGVHAPGTLLRQEELAKRFKTSRMPIRDSLKILEREGLIVLPANRSAQVAPLDPKSFRDISEMRAVAEPLALKHAIPELTNRQIEVASVIQHEAEQAVSDQFSKLNKAFHAALLTPCERPRLLNHIATLNDLSERYFHVAVVEMSYADHSHKEHQDLIKACKQRDVETACRILEAHISSASERILDNLKSDTS